MVDVKLLWKRIQSQAVNDIRMYEEALEVSKSMLELSENKLLFISGNELKRNC